MPILIALAVFVLAVLAVGGSLALAVILTIFEAAAGRKS